MSNEAVIRMFLRHQEAHTPTRDIQNGVYTYKGQTLNSTGDKLWNYNTILAYHLDNNVVALNTNKYSTTTSKIQNKIRMLAKEYNIIIKEVK